jgi:hypothetical protein
MQAADAPRLAAAYFLVQAAAVAAWWGMLLAVPGSRPWFLPAGRLDPAFVAFLAPDLVVLSAGSAITGVFALRQHPLARAGSWFVAGAVTYATFYTLAWTVLVQAPVLSAFLMMAAAAGSIAAARALTRKGT